jgi:hypothetical protein
MIKRARIMVCLALALAACAPAPVAVLSDYAVTPEFSRDLLDRELPGRVVRVVVHGDPFGLPGAAFAGQVAAEMNQAGAVEARFATRADNDFAPGWTVVWNFAPPQALAPDAVCAGPADGAPAHLPIDGYVALCRAGKALTAVRARLYYADTPNSVEFIALVDDATRALFPRDLPAFRRPGDATIAPQVPHLAR